jgi:hypothetical protein
MRFPTRRVDHGTPSMPTSDPGEPVGIRLAVVEIKMQGPRWHLSQGALKYVVNEGPEGLKLGETLRIAPKGTTMLSRMGRQQSMRHAVGQLS